MLVVDVAAQTMVHELPCVGDAVPNRVMFTRDSRELVYTDNSGIVS